jgi:NADH dehydrogenase (ubiquinone) Fe-S protein 4
MLQAACYSSAKIPEDFAGLVQKEVPHAKDIAEHLPTPDKEIGMCAGVPLETFKRKARIYTSARTAGQQGMANTIYNNKGRPWRIGFETQDKWINPLMGWTSTADPLENVARASLFFYTKEEAIAFCNKHGWEPVVEDPKPRRADRQKRFAGYGENFSVKRGGIPDLSNYPSNRGFGTPTTGSSTAGSSKQ